MVTFKLWTQIKPDNKSGPIWIQASQPSDGIPDLIFEKLCLIKFDNKRAWKFAKHAKSKLVFINE